VVQLERADVNHVTILAGYVVVRRPRTARSAPLVVRAV
jgi:hypothetical protein